MENVQRYTFYCWLDVNDVIQFSGMCPTDGLGEFPNWERPGLRYVESNLGELTSELTHYYDPADGKFYRREEPAGRAATAPLDLPPMTWMGKRD